MASWGRRMASRFSLPNSFIPVSMMAGTLVRNRNKWKQFEYPLWTSEGDAARKNGGHGGMDYIMIDRLLHCVREGLPPDMDVYDAAAWSSVGPLSEMSVAQGSAPVVFPDFTRGGWSCRPASAIATQA